MTDQFIATEDRLLDAMVTAVRGPKRNALFALWLFVRQCDGDVPPFTLSPAASRRRLELLERRLSSLSLPPPLRRGLSGALHELHEDGTPDIAFALLQLVAPTREALGPTIADAIAYAARKARAITQENGGRR